MPLFIQNQSLLSLVLLLLDTMTQAAPAPGSPRRRCPSQPQPTAPGHEKGTLRHSVMSSRPQHRHVLIIRGLKVRQMAHGSPHEPATPRTPAAQPSNSFQYVYTDIRRTKGKAHTQRLFARVETRDLRRVRQGQGPEGSATCARPALGAASTSFLFRTNLVWLAKFAVGGPNCRPEPAALAHAFQAGCGCGFLRSGVWVGNRLSLIQIRGSGLSALGCQEFMW
ncbi:hypothetical protein BJX66DRAFT_1885 [Aspergillus keveii]|uniref:Uncharacterized protein n=1 Tax=Aspergillus keveii TaxID=714993 RepID=A0ABR4GPZ2_9EURO